MFRIFLDFWGIHREDFFGGIFLEKFLGEIFRVDFLKELFGRNYLVEIDKELMFLLGFCGNFVSMKEGRKEKNLNP